MNKQTMMSLKLSGVALAVMQAFAPQAVAQEQQADANSTVVVTGIRASARSSVAIKRDTLEVVDSITAEDIGKLPDNNVAETLTRIPGVQGYRYGGRGFGPDHPRPEQPDCIADQRPRLQHRRRPRIQYRERDPGHGGRHRRVQEPVG
jgi:hypothetical protein